MRGGRELTPHEIPPQPGQSRYRLAQRGPFYAVQKWRRRFWIIGGYGWFRVAPWIAADCRYLPENQLQALQDREAFRANAWKAEDQP